MKKWKPGKAQRIPKGERPAPIASRNRKPAPNTEGTPAPDFADPEADMKAAEAEADPEIKHAAEDAAAEECDAEDDCEF